MLRIVYGIKRYSKGPKTLFSVNVLSAQNCRRKFPKLFIYMAREVVSLAARENILFSVMRNRFRNGTTFKFDTLAARIARLQSVKAMHY